jgi:CRP-like cAMP-binding protein/Fe-S-cluster-containing dehydrogenase component
VLGRKGKGYEAGIAFDLNNLMGDSSCISCGECMVSCPTGALTNKSVIGTVLPQGEPVSAHFLKRLPYFEEVSGTFLDLNKNAVVERRYKAGEVICREGEYGSTAFFILEGQAEMLLNPMASRKEERASGGSLLERLTRKFKGEPTTIEMPRWSPASAAIDLWPGDLFGETSCVSHYPRGETVRAVTDCVALEMLRNVLDMMLQRNGDLRSLLDSNYRGRVLRTQLRQVALFAPASDAFIAGLRDCAELVRMKKGDTICQQGTEADCFYFIRNGFVKVSEDQPGGEMVLAYLGPRQYFGDGGVLSGGLQPTTVMALDTVDLVRIREHAFRALAERYPDDAAKLVALRAKKTPKAPPRPATKIDVSLKTFVAQGLMEANSALLLDLEKCTRCDACVRACADAHDGVTRFVREGLRFDKYLVASSCRQCRDPLCMVGCPVGSIRRRNSLEILIEDWCIGCGLCSENCPYGNIHMQPVTAMLAESPFPMMQQAAVKQKATSCDLCSGLAEPSCVYACPHDAAMRVDASAFFGILPAVNAAE